MSSDRNDQQRPVTATGGRAPVGFERQRVSRRGLLVGGACVVGGAAVAAATIGSGDAQDLNPGPATPVPIGPTIPPELTQYANDWPAPQGNLAAQRAAGGSAITSANVNQLEVAWTWDITASTPWGGMFAGPLIVGDTVYVQDTMNNVFALDRATGAVKWEQRYEVGTGGPNGLAIGYGMIYGTLGYRDDAQFFALDAATGAEVWTTQVTGNPLEGADMAPIVYDNTVYVSTCPTGSDAQQYTGGTKGILFALGAKNGDVIWQFDTTTDNLWGMARVNSGGGLWMPPSIDADGNLYFGVGNPSPFPGVVAFGTPWPNGSSRPGPNPYTDSMMSLDTTTGAMRWVVNARPHDIFDLDFMNTPVLAPVAIGGQPVNLAIGSGKSGELIAADAGTGAVMWQTTVGTQQGNRAQAVPEGVTMSVIPGTVGGVETAMAFADGTLFVPVDNLAQDYSAFDALAQIITDGTGELVALNAADGTVKWQVDLPQLATGAATVANDVVFTGTIAGIVYAYEAATGRELWTYQTSAGLNAPFAIAGDLLLVPSAGPFIGGPTDITAKAQLLAFRLPAGAATPTATPTG